HAAGMEAIELVGVIAIDGAAAAIANQAVAAETTDLNVGVIVRPGGVEGPAARRTRSPPADAAGCIRLHRFTPGPHLMPTGVLAHHDRIGRAVDHVEQP